MGKYPTETGCCNGQAFPAHIITLADYSGEAGYDTARVGKRHLASTRTDCKGAAAPDHERSAIPLKGRGGHRGSVRAPDNLAILPLSKYH